MDFIKENDHVVLQNNECIFCFKIEEQKSVKILSFKILLSKIIGLFYNSLYVFHDDKFSKISQSTFQENFSINHENELNGEILSDQSISEEINITNDTFKDRTVYSKYKYIQRKKRKLCLEISFFRPTPRLIWKVMNLKCANKICYISYQDLANITCLNNINSLSHQNVMVFETCQGLIVGSILKKMGGNGNLIQIYYCDFPNRTCMEYLQLSDNIKNPLCAITYHGLLAYIKKTDFSPIDKDNTPTIDVSDEESMDLKDTSDGETSPKVTGLKRMISNITHEPEEPKDEKRAEEKLARKANRKREEDKAIDILNLDSQPSDIRHLDCLIIATKFHPTAIALTLIKFLKYSRPFSIYCQYREPLMDCFQKLKDTESVLNMDINETWLRTYQVLPDRTHPTISIDGRSGYVLSGICVDPVIRYN